MENKYYINPDIDLINFLNRDCGQDLSTCMQCGSCTAVCELSSDNSPWPRKEMIWASWGLKDKLLADPDIWLCHNCGDCSDTCPRDIKPGAIMASLRNYNYLYYARPKFLARWIQSPRFLPLLVMIPAFLMIGVMLLAGTFKIPDGPINYSNFFPHAWLNGSFSIIVFLMVFGLMTSINKFIKDLKIKGYRVKTEKQVSFFKTISKILRHKDFNKCKTNRLNYISHLLVFWGFALLLIVTMFAIIGVLLFEYPFSITHPVKIAGNIGGIALIFGSGLMLVNRFNKRKKRGVGNYTDYLFVISLFLLGFSGMLVEGARVHEMNFAYHLYFVHLLLVWVVIIYIPFTKFSHFIYRTIVMLYSG